MIEYLRGKVIEKKKNYLLVICNDLGYGVNVSDYTHECCKIDQNISLFSHLRVREDSLELYGFIEKSEKEIFLLLTSVSGIGFKTAITLLSKINYRDLHRSIIEENITLLSTAPGIGKKTAKKIVLELKDKCLKTMNFELNVSSDNKGSSANLEDAINALVKLGFKKQYAQREVLKITKNSDLELSIPDIITLVLKNNTK